MPRNIPTTILAAFLHGETSLILAVAAWYMSKQPDEVARLFDRDPEEVREIGERLNGAIG